MQIITERKQRQKPKQMRARHLHMMSAVHWLAGSGACGMVQTKEIEYFLRAHQVKSVKIILPYAVDTGN